MSCAGDVPSLASVVSEGAGAYDVGGFVCGHCCCTQGRHQRPQSTKGLRASFRPWVAICLRRLSRRLAKAWSHRLHGPARQSLRNAKAESFMKTLKVEAVYLMAYETFEDVTAPLRV